MFGIFTDPKPNLIPATPFKQVVTRETQGGKVV